MLGILGGEGKQENKNEVQEMENYGAEAGSAVKLLEELLNLGYRKNASDIHLEPQEDRMVVRMRLACCSMCGNMTRKCISRW